MMDMHLTPFETTRGIPGHEQPIVVLDNANVFVEYRPTEKEIFARDKRDLHNEPACYTTHKRGIKNAWLALTTVFTADTTHRDVMQTFSRVGMPYHYWCMVD